MNMSEKTLVHMTADGPASQRYGGVTWTPGREAELDAETAEVALDAFEYFEEGPAPDAGGEADSEADGSDNDSAITTEDVTPDEEGDAFDEDAWLEPDFSERADRVAAGDVDEHLDVIADVERSDTVLDAVGERRAELEEEA